MFDWLTVFQDPNVQWILIGCMLLGVSSGVIGSFAYLRKQSLMGDALSHAALPGVCIAFMLSGSKSIVFFLIGAAAAGIVTTFGIGFITRNTRIKQDTALAIVLSTFFGLGIVLLTQIQHSGNGNQSGLDKFLFGQAATMMKVDVLIMVIFSIVLIGICTILFKEFKLLSFDPGFARGIGYPVAFLDQLIMFLIVVAVVVGIQAVGVVLMASLLITPAVTARYWTEKLGLMVVFSGVIGAFSGLAGTFISANGNNLPTGPLIMLVATSMFVFSVIAAPRRGILSKIMLRASVRSKVRQEQSMLQVDRGEKSV
ncbi:metal ABC transporter permease [Paenibacillus solisilvae]|uniref:Metal ABC transporter permease n=1 Tax=Paenibacillus solisilvae TaxID=2486751 RepID=A0ABW0VPU9_9BACL